MSHQHHHHSKRVLFLLKEHSYGNYTIVKSGLLNSVKLLLKALYFFRLIKEGRIAICIDANFIDREVDAFKPDICFIEAIWVTGKKLAELRRLHPKVIFIVRVHSNIPFLAMEGNAIERLKEYFQIPGVFISFNNEFTNSYLGWLFNPIYLPNIYFETLRHHTKVHKEEVNIGCFGSIRPLKNQLLQAVAAINYGYNNQKVVNYHINSARIEQSGENVLKNIRELFVGTVHKLIEHKWLSHDEFLKVIEQMDIGLQVSFTESFNIVTADFVSCEVPIIVSEDISWMPTSLQVRADDAFELEMKIKEVIHRPRRFIKRQTSALEDYNDKAVKTWGDFLK